MDEDVRVVMPDPDGSGLYNKVSGAEDKTA